jgi:hypothetical protein
LKKTVPQRIIEILRPHDGRAGNKLQTAQYEKPKVFYRSFACYILHIYMVNNLFSCFPSPGGVFPVCYCTHSTGRRPPNRNSIRKIPRLYRQQKIRNRHFRPKLSIGSKKWVEMQALPPIFTGNLCLYALSTPYKACLRFFQRVKNCTSLRENGFSVACD